MSDLVRTIHEFAEMFDRLGMPYAIMGGWAVRLYGLPRPTYDIDFTIAAASDRLGELYAEVTGLAGRGKSPPDVFPRLKTSGFHGSCAPGNRITRAISFAHAIREVSCERSF